MTVLISTERCLRACERKTISLVLTLWVFTGGYGGGGGYGGVGGYKDHGT